MAWRQLTDAQWDQIRLHLPPAKCRPRLAGRSPTPDGASKASSGSSGQERHGASCPGGMPARPPVGDA